MLLGNSIGASRCVTVWSAATATAALVARPVASRAGSGWSAVRDGAIDRLPLDQALVSLAATALVGCLLWAWLAVSVVVLEAARGAAGERASPGRGPWKVPESVRRLVLVACGVALVGTASPSAVADTHGHPGSVHGVAGLPLPDRATAPLHRTVVPDTRAPRTVVVHPGDSLWSIAADHLPPGSSDARVTTRWRALYAVNRTVVGADPDHIEPGQRLRLPRKDLP